MVGSEVAGIPALAESVVECGAPQPTCQGRHRGRRSPVQTDRPAGLPSFSPDVCGDDDGAADGDRRLPPHLLRR